jgi:hypothetical protein
MTRTLLERLAWIAAMLAGGAVLLLAMLAATWAWTRYGAALAARSRAALALHARSAAAAAARWLEVWGGHFTDAAGLHWWRCAGCRCWYCHAETAPAYSYRHNGVDRLCCKAGCVPERLRPMLALLAADGGEAA